MSRRVEIPLWRWAQWTTSLAVALVLFYVLLTPVWFSLRALAWAAEFRERRRKPVGPVRASADAAPPPRA